MEIIQCYLCDGKAQLRLDSDEGNYVNCPNCLYYRLTTGAMIFFFNKTDKGGLDSEALNKLIDYIKDGFDPNVGEAVKLSAGIINEVMEQF